MLARSDIHRSIASMTIDLHRSIDRRKNLTNAYKMGEREYQTQIEFSGQVGTLPAEATTTITFSDTLVFMADVGIARDSQLSRPQFRPGWELLYGPAGLVPYAFVQSWAYDDDLNYTGAVINLGVHCPAMYVAGADAPANLAFKGLLHASFQGYAVPFDPGGPLPDDGGVNDT
jgi:hypothetical protein